MATTINYPCNLPNLRVNANSYQHQSLTRQDTRSSGPVVIRLFANTGWQSHQGSTVLTEVEAQALENFWYYTLSRGSKSFNIDLKVPGGFLSHEAYITDPPVFAQVGRLWSVTLNMLSIARKGLDECDSQSLLAAFDGFEAINANFDQLDTIIETLDGPPVIVTGKQQHI